jgi:hypothetical protein
MIGNRMLGLILQAVKVIDHDNASIPGKRYLRD